MAVPSLVLASSSPRRRELLAGLGLSFEVRPAVTDESFLAGESPHDAAERLAREKASQVAAGFPGDTAVVAADTIVVLDCAVIPSNS